MAPALFARQLEAGAWAITVATVSQARVARAFGVPRILIANEVVEPAAVRWIATEARREMTRSTASVSSIRSPASSA